MKTKLTIALLAMIATTQIAQADTRVYAELGDKNEIKYLQFHPDAPSCTAISDTPIRAALANNKCVYLDIRSDGRVNTPGQTADNTNPDAAALQNRNADLQRQINEAEARETAERCRVLRNNLANLNIGGRLYDIDDNGNRSYLTEQEINSRRERIQQAINQFCQ